MALGHLSTSASAAGTGTLTWTHTPSATARGICVLIVQNIGVTDEVTGVTYGGVDMAEVPGSPLVVAAGAEDGVIYAYFLGSGIPTGAQTVEVAVDATGSTKRANLYNVSAADDTSVEDAVASDLGVVANPSVTLATSVDTYVCGAVFSGQNTTGAVTAPADTSQTLTNDFGSQVCVWHRRQTVPLSAGSPTLGATATAEEAGVFAVAIREGVAVTNVPLGQPAETETALGATARKTAPLSQAQEGETALPVTARKTVALGQVVETETAFGITVQGPTVVPLSQVVETEVALPVTARETVALGQPGEAEQALPLTVVRRFGLGQAVETETALTVLPSGPLFVALGQPAETETAPPVTVRKTVALGPSVETDVALGLARVVKTVQLGQAVELETALAVTATGGLIITRLEAGGGVSGRVSAAAGTSSGAVESGGAVTGRVGG